MRFLQIGILFLVTLAFTASVFAQDSTTVSAAGNLYVISAKAGAVNALTGTAKIIRADGTNAQLKIDDTVEIGDRVETGAGGMAEILLNPGSFLRLGPNSSFQFKTTALDNLALRLTEGSAILEIFASKDFKVSVDIPGDKLVFTKSGVFRIDLLTGGQSRVAVWKGQFLIGKNALEVNSGHAVTLGGQQSSIAKFDRDGKDALDVWSQLRGKEAARINDKLKRDLLRDSLVNSFARGGWNYYSSFGVWVFDARSRRWCFLPFGSSWYSPYGYYYGFDIFRCRLPYWVFTPPITPVNPPVNPSPNAVQPLTMRDTRRQIVTPPVVQFEQTVRNETRSDNTKGSGSGGPGPTRSIDRRMDDWKSNQPVFTPSQPSNPSPQPVPIIVGPTRSDTKKDN